jgi:hypothetical protein
MLLSYRLRGRSGFAGLALGVVAGFVVVFDAGLLAAPLPVGGVPVVVCGGAAGVVGGSVVMGVGSGGNGFVGTLAMSSVVPVYAVSACVR